MVVRDMENFPNQMATELEDNHIASRNLVDLPFLRQERESD